MNRYRKPGWYGESHRHYLAAKGVGTRRYSKEKLITKALAEMGMFNVLSNEVVGEEVAERQRKGDDELDKMFRGELSQEEARKIWEKKNPGKDWRTDAIGVDEE